MSEKSINDWNQSDMERRGFDAEGKRKQGVSGAPEFIPSPGFANWLQESQGSLIASTYQSGRILFLGTTPTGQFYTLDRAIGTAMGLAVDQDKLWVGTREQIWRFSNTGPLEFKETQFSANYMPRTCHMVGQSNTHDVLADVSFRGQHYDFLYANTQYSCIAAIDPHYSFKPIWTPDFISELVPEDRCHLNGIGARDGELRYASFCGRTDAPLLWKEHQTGTGFIMDLATEKVVCEGLSMPHSPRWHDGKLWILNSGEGEFGYVDFDTKSFVSVAKCAGFARGLTFVGDLAVVGLSCLRPKKGIMPGINLQANLEARKVLQRCGLQLFNYKTGKLEHWLTIEGPVSELYDVVFLANQPAPYSPGFKEPELHQRIMNLPN
ncbi:MAG: TIGR03032 family protein [Marinomonas atlantica]|nr:TIGR03032 family protein [Marinomonas atlantica]